MGRAISRQLALFVVCLLHSVCNLQITSNQGQVIRANLTPQFKFPPDWPSQKYYEENGPGFSLNCFLVPGPSVQMKWTKDGKQLPQHSATMFISNGNQTLTFVKPRKSDTGKYACVAWNEFGNLKYERPILVIGRKDEIAPVVVETAPVSSPLAALVGDPVNLTCVFNVGGSDTALMDLRTVWLVNELPLNDTNHTAWFISVQEDTNNEIFSLHIDALQETDYGEYSCLGWNSIGNGSQVLEVVPPHRPVLGKFSQWEYVVVGAAVFAIVAMTTVVAGCYRYRHRGNRYETLEWDGPDVAHYDVPTDGFQYDVFISYSSEDLIWVKEHLFTNLTGQKYSVCVDFKDFTPGMAVSENILDAVYKSRKTIVVMSRNFLKSMWGQFELQQAHFRAIAQRSDVLLLVKLDSCKVPGKLLGKTFLDWSNPDVQPHFWQRLYQSIGEPCVTSAVTTTTDDVISHTNTMIHPDSGENVLQNENSETRHIENVAVCHLKTNDADANGNFKTNLRSDDEKYK